MKTNRRFCINLIFIILIIFCISAPGQSAEGVKNVILLIGDGMGNGARTLTHLLYRAEGRKLAMESFPVAGLINTYSMNYPVTDSAAAGSALATGFKTNNKMISVDPDGNFQVTILEKARQAGYRVGLVSNTPISHATPGSFGGHSLDRNDKYTIAEQILANGTDVMLGGGRKYFSYSKASAKYPERPDLIARARDSGYKVVFNRRELIAAGAQPKLLGLFTDNQMEYDIDRKVFSEPALNEMTSSAIRSLSNEKGFFLMVEGGRIDQAAHGHDAATIVSEVEAFDKAVAVALAFAQNRNDTLVIVTADHETGGVSILERARVEWLRKVSRSCEWLATQNRIGKLSISDIFTRYIRIPGLEVTDLPAELMKDYQYNAPLGFGHFVSKFIGVSFIDIDDQVRSKSTFGHTGAAVPIFAYGVGSNHFSGVFDNTEVPRKIAALLDLTLPEPSREEPDWVLRARSSKK
ncbi:MAG: alkaline phosphatase [Candidatus Wallbacteria bacterium HGW-Wallbacteria-1]|jgi:alkaline phosphatase|uniref:Alkaline phosphatase n=1 Tax=Candidatus Wallbacteria bacterium HGW-Wallbacteria-1 TaxID=2013854 RepID=A0A2N1PR33_9BACT|nr:MAG: alkaline phosphatase [Candidatus Wallbacteria bacterium HGW-Wallbacteria-1]